MRSQWMNLSGIMFRVCRCRNGTDSLYGPDPRKAFCGSPYDKDSFWVLRAGNLRGAAESGWG